MNADLWYEDLDADGFGNPDVSIASCDPVNGYTSNAMDCNDTDPNVSPNADELCDEQDNDCDGEIDENDALDVSVWYADMDNDGFGDVASPNISCAAPNQHVDNTLDCDDQNPSVHPNMDELCDGIDNNCDGAIDGTDSIDIQ